MSLFFQVYAAASLAAGGGSCSLGAVRGASCAAPLEGARLVLGGDFGLALLDLERAELVPRRQHAPVHTLRYVMEEQLLGKIYIFKFIKKSSYPEHNILKTL